MIERIYLTVLSILNKEQRGYITAEEFSQYAQQAQQEIFENYFFELGRATAQYGPMTDMFSNIPDHVFEKLNIFRENMELTTTDGSYTLPTNLYRLGNVFWANVIVDMIDHKMIRYVLNSPLTAPTRTQPVYTRTGNILSVFPTVNQTAQIEIEYIRNLPTEKTPETPVDGVDYIPEISVVAINGDQQITVVQDFVLHSTEEPELVAKILSYAGVSVRANDVAQAGVGKDQSINQQEV